MLARVTLLLSLLLVIGLTIACTPNQSSSANYDRARATFVHGDLVASQREAEDGYRRFRRSSPELAWKYRVLEGESLLWSGRYQEVLTLLDSSAADSAPSDLKVSVLALQAVALGRRLDLTAADQKLQEAERLCTDPNVEGCGEAFQARGLLALGQNQFAQAQISFRSSLAIAKTKRDTFLENNLSP